MYCKQYCVCTPPSTALFMDKCKHIKTNPCTYQKCKYSIFIVLWSLKLWPFCNFTKLSEINTKIWKLFIWLTFESTSLFYIKWNSRKKSHRETSCFNTNYDKVWWEVVLKAHNSEFFHVFEWCTDRWRDHTGSQETVVCVCVCVCSCMCLLFLSFFFSPRRQKVFWLQCLNMSWLLQEFRLLVFPEALLFFSVLAIKTTHYIYQQQNWKKKLTNVIQETKKLIPSIQRI